MGKKISYEDCLDFIENCLNIELLDYQKYYLRCICENTVAIGGRGCGRTTVIKGYTKYLSYLLEENNYAVKPDTIISYPKGEGYYSETYIIDESGGKNI